MRSYHGADPRLHPSKHTHNRDTGKTSGQASQQFNIWTIWSMDRTLAQPQVNLSLMRSNSLKFQPMGRLLWSCSVYVDVNHLRLSPPPLLYCLIIIWISQYRWLNCYGCSVPGQKEQRELRSDRSIQYLNNRSCGQSLSSTSGQTFVAQKFFKNSRLKLQVTTS